METPQDLVHAPSSWAGVGGDSEPGKNSLFWLPRVNRAGEAGVVGD